MEGRVVARATDDDPRRLVAAMAMLSPPTNSGRSKAFISKYLRRAIPPQRDERYGPAGPVTRDEEGLSEVRRQGQGPTPQVLPHLGGLRARPPFSGCLLGRRSRLSRQEREDDK